MIVIPAGKFMMGSPENEPDRNASEGPQHEVTISKPFAVSKFEVTFVHGNVWEWVEDSWPPFPCPIRHGFRVARTIAP
jgi:formylglycine-generating enzyme required for sulfatase activity